LSAAPLLAALLGAALPGLRALDLGLPAPALFPWLPGTLCGVADAVSLPPAEAALLGRFRHPDGRPLAGFDRAADAALLAGAPAAWKGAPERLIRVATVQLPRALPADALLLARPDVEDASGAPRARILLLLGAGETVHRHDLLVPAPRLEAIHAALRRTAEDLAGTLEGRWLAHSLAISANMASVALLPEEAQSHLPRLSVPAETLVHDLPTRAEPDGLHLSDPPRVRLLLGTVPARLRVVLRGDASGAALFGDGRRLPATPVESPTGETCLEAAAWRPGAGAAVLGIAVPASVRAVLTRLELLP
jgi:hypothetical protein